MLRTARILVAAFLVVGSAAACDDDDPTDTPQTVTIDILDNEFDPPTATVDVGTRVRWVNEGDDTHNVTSADGDWGSDNLDSGETYERTFSTAGTFEYECTLHEGMTGTIEVE